MARAKVLGRKLTTIEEESSHPRQLPTHSIKYRMYEVRGKKLKLRRYLKLCSVQA